MMANTSRAHRIGDILIEEGMISPEQLDEALTLREDSGELLGHILKDMGLVTESDIAKIVCVQFQLPFLSLANYSFDETLVELFQPNFLHRHMLLPFDKVGNTLLVLVTEIPQDEPLAEIPKQTGLNAGLYVGFGSEVNSQLERLCPLSEEERAKRRAPAKATAVAAKAKKKAEGASDDEDDQILFSGDSESLLQELDSTWDSIFENLDAPQEGADDDADTGSGEASNDDD